MKFDHIDKVRKHLLLSLEKLENHSIELEEIDKITSLCETVFSSLKLQLSYDALTGKKSIIDFLEQPNLVSEDNIRRLEDKFNSK